MDFDQFWKFCDEVQAQGAASGRISLKPMQKLILSPQQRNVRAFSCEILENIVRIETHRLQTQALLNLHCSAPIFPVQRFC